MLLSLNWLPFLTKEDQNLKSWDWFLIPGLFFLTRATSFCFPDLFGTDQKCQTSNKNRRSANESCWTTHRSRLVSGPARLATWLRLACPLVLTFFSIQRKLSNSFSLDQTKTLTTIETQSKSKVRQTSCPKTTQSWTAFLAFQGKSNLFNLTKRTCSARNSWPNYLKIFSTCFVVHTENGFISFLYIKKRPKMKTCNVCRLN